MQDMSPQAIDHEAIMRMIREGAAFRQASPVERLAPEDLGPGFRAVGLDEVARRPADTPEAGKRAPTAIHPAQGESDDFRPVAEPAVFDPDAIRAEARAEGRAEAEAEATARVEAARAEGHAAGHTEAMAGAAAELDDARRALLAATEAVARGIDEALPRLFTSIEGAILRLASERAGLAIDANPEPFRRRIEALVERVVTTGADTEIRLNPEDIAALGAVRLPPGIQADPTLARGDAMIRVGDVRLDDILARGARTEGAR